MRTTDGIQTAQTDCEDGAQRSIASRLSQRVPECPSAQAISANGAVQLKPDVVQMQAHHCVLRRPWQRLCVTLTRKCVCQMWVRAGPGGVCALPKNVYVDVNVNVHSPCVFSCRQGWDKTYCLRFIPEFETVHFFGDKTYPVSAHRTWLDCTAHYWWHRVMPRSFGASGCCSTVLLPILNAQRNRMWGVTTVRWAVTMACIASMYESAVNESAAHFRLSYSDACPRWCGSTCWSYPCAITRRLSAATTLPMSVRQRSAPSWCAAKDVFSCPAWVTQSPRAGCHQHPKVRCRACNRSYLDRNGRSVPVRRPLCAPRRRRSPFLSRHRSPAFLR